MQKANPHQAHILFVTGGQRSGKSSYAQQLAQQWSPSPVYLATSRIWDEGHRARIERHRSERGQHWVNIEEEKKISAHDLRGQVVLMDCVTLWLTNYFFDNASDIDLSLSQAKAEFDLFSQQQCTLIIVSNEIGLGGHPSHELQMKFTDLQGWMNQYIAARADAAVLMVSGIPVTIKGCVDSFGLKSQLSDSLEMPHK